MTDDQNRWTIMQAKGRFRESIDRTISDGPQMITRRGHDAVVFVSAEAWARIVQTDEPTSRSDDASQRFDERTESPRDSARG